MFTCPVCGYNQLPYPPEDFNICPSCYTEFGYEDATGNYQALTEAWIQSGMQWAAANVMPPPPNWNPYKQLENLSNVIEAKAVAITQDSPTGLVKIGEKVKVIQEEPRVTSQGDWLVIGNLAEGVRIAAHA